MKIEELKDCESWDGEIIKRHGWDYYFPNSEENAKMYKEIILKIKTKYDTYARCIPIHYDIFSFHSDELNLDLKLLLKPKHKSKAANLLRNAKVGNIIKANCIIANYYDFDYFGSTEFDKPKKPIILKIIKAEIIGDSK